MGDPSDKFSWSRVFQWTELVIPNLPGAKTRLHVLKTSFVFAQAELVYLVALGAAFLFSYVYWTSVDIVVLVSWLTGFIFLTAGRGVLVDRYRRATESSRFTKNWSGFYGIGEFISAIFWGVASFVLYSSSSGDLAFLTFLLLAMNSVGVVFLSPIRALPYLFVIPTLMPNALVYLLRGDKSALVMSLLVFAYGYVLLNAAARVRRALEKSLRVAIDREQVEEELRLAKGRAESLTDKLTLEVQERKLIEEQLRESADELSERNRELDESVDVARAANRSKTTFLANMSHEIRTPLNAIIGMTELALSESDEEERTVLLETALSSARSLLVVINDILDFSKIEVGKLELSEKTFSFRGLILHLERVFTLRAKKKNVEMVLVVEEDVPNEIISDSDRLQQVLSNLIDNALKFTPRAGGVIIYIKKISENDEQVELSVSVADTGIGIPKDKQEKIFESFTQAEQYITRSYGGTGLGLAICHQIVGLMGGQLQVKSIEGIGSRFYFELLFEKGELADSSQGSQLRAIETNDDANGLRVLSVEDNAVNQMLMVKLLEKVGCQVTLASNGVEAVEIFQEDSFHLILMDCQMPVLDGYDATRRIRELERGSAQHTPIIAVTAHAMGGDAERCRAAGMDEHIAKPVDKDILFGLIRRYARDLLSRDS